MVGLATDDGAQRDQRVELLRLGHLLQGQRNFQRARDGHVQDVLVGHAQMLQFCQACRQQAMADIGIETCLHDTDAQAFTCQIAFKSSYRHGYASCSFVD